MKVLLIDNTKDSQDEFTQQLFRTLSSIIPNGNVVRCSTSDEVMDEVEMGDVSAVVLSGSSLNLSQPNTLGIIRKNTSTLLRVGDIPVLGICFGMQLLCNLYGGTVKRMKKAVKEEVDICVKSGSVLLNRRSTCIRVTLSHQDCVHTLPRDFTSFSEHEGRIMLTENEKLMRFGVQFHPEKQAVGEQENVLSNFIHFVTFTRPSVFRGIAEVHNDAIRLLASTKNLYAVEREFPDIPREDLMAAWRKHLKDSGQSAYLL